MKLLTLIELLALLLIIAYGANGKPINSETSDVTEWKDSSVASMKSAFTGRAKQQAEKDDEDDDDFGLEDDDDEDDDEEEKAPGDKPAATDDDEEDSGEDDDDEEADDDDDDDDDDEDDDDESQEGGAGAADGEKDAENDDEDSDEFVLFGDDLFDDLFEDDDDNKKSSSTAKPAIEVASIASNQLPVSEAVVSVPQKVSAVVSTEDKLDAEQPIVDFATDEKPQPLPIDSNDDNSIEDDSIFVSDDTPIVTAEKNTITNGDVFYDEAGADSNGKPFKNDKDMETLTAMQHSTVKPEIVKATKKASTKAKKPAKEDEGDGGILDIVDTLISDEDDDDDDDDETTALEQELLSSEGDTQSDDSNKDEKNDEASETAADEEEEEEKPENDEEEEGDDDEEDSEENAIDAIEGRKSRKIKSSTRQL